MKRVLKRISSILLVIVAVAIWCIYSYEQNSEAILTSTSVISNTKIGWGVKRAENHAQPDLGKTNVSLMQEYERYLYGKCIKKIRLSNI